MYRLKSYSKVPPENYWYRQTEGVQKTFDADPVIYDVAWQLLELRKGNKLDRATIEECLEDVDTFTVNRLIAAYGPKNEWIYDTQKSFARIHPPASIQSCRSCGARV